MRRFIPILLLVLLFGACFVQTRERRAPRSVKSRSCPPAYHWEDGACVHNGKAKGHHKK